jgi:hypothetical protein
VAGKIYGQQRWSRPPFAASHFELQPSTTQFANVASQHFTSDKVNGNRFKIAGGKPGMEVSWQLTGVRKDAYAETHRIQVEEMKPVAERGSYLHPDAFGKSIEKGVRQAYEKAQR